jgi:hypothetical protein
MKLWERSPLEIEIIEDYESEIIGEEQEDFLVAFSDIDGGIVEAKINKKEFEGFPYQLDEGTFFGIFVYKEKENNQTKAAVGPTLKYWNPEWRKECQQ